MQTSSSVDVTQVGLVLSVIFLFTVMIARRIQFVSAQFAIDPSAFVLLTSLVHGVCSHIYARQASAKTMADVWWSMRKWPNTAISVFVPSNLLIGNVSSRKKS